MKIHQSSIAHVCVTKYGSYISGGGCILILKTPQIKLMSKACKLSVFLSTVKCLTNMELYSSLADDVHRITSMWGHDIKPVFDDFRCWTIQVVWIIGLVDFRGLPVACPFHSSLNAMQINNALPFIKTHCLAGD